MVDRDHRQWLEDEEERRAMKGTKRTTPKRHGMAPKEDSASDIERERLSDLERKNLQDWTQDPIA